MASMHDSCNVIVCRTMLHRAVFCATMLCVVLPCCLVLCYWYWYHAAAREAAFHAEILGLPGFDPGAESFDREYLVGEAGRGMANLGTEICRGEFVVHRGSKGAPGHNAFASATHRTMQWEVGGIRSETSSRCLGSSKPITGLNLLAYAWKTEGYNFIEFEISDCTVSTVFRQPLS